MSFDVKQAHDGAVFRVKAVPNASKTVSCGSYAGMLKVKVASVPERGRANGELKEYLSEMLGAAKSRIRIIKGETSREKTILAEGMKKNDVIRILEEANAGSEEKNK